MSHHHSEYFNFVQYLYAVSETYFPTGKVLTWGLKENGRLGLGDDDDLDKTGTQNEDVSKTDNAIDFSKK